MGHQLKLYQMKFLHSIKYLEFFRQIDQYGNIAVILRKNIREIENPKKSCEEKSSKILKKIKNKKIK